MPREMLEGVAKMILPGALSMGANGAFDVSPTWNELLPDMEFTGVEKFLTGVFGEQTRKR